MYIMYTHTYIYSSAVIEDVGICGHTYAHTYIHCRYIRMYSHRYTCTFVSTYLHTYGTYLDTHKTALLSLCPNTNCKVCQDTRLLVSVLIINLQHCVHTIYTHTKCAREVLYTINTH